MSSPCCLNGLTQPASHPRPRYHIQLCRQWPAVAARPDSNGLMVCPWESCRYPEMHLRAPILRTALQPADRTGTLSDTRAEELRHWVLRHRHAHSIGLTDRSRLTHDTTEQAHRRPCGQSNTRMAMRPQPGPHALLSAVCSWLGVTARLAHTRLSEGGMRQEHR